MKGKGGTTLNVKNRRYDVTFQPREAGSHQLACTSVLGSSCQLAVGFTYLTDSVRDKTQGAAWIQDGSHRALCGGGGRAGFGGEYKKRKHLRC